MKANPYVYPFVDFKDLSKKETNWQLNPKEIWSIADLEKFLNELNFPVIKSKGKNTAEKIFNIFLDSEILYGEATNLTVDQQQWLNKFNYFIDRKKPIELTIHGFPFKIPNPLKSDRIYPDMGEIAAIWKLVILTKSIKNAYPQGAKVTIIGEGGFAKFVGVSDNEWMNYRSYLQKLLKQLKIANEIKIIDIALLEKEPDFEITFNRIKKDLMKRYKGKDKTIEDKINGTIDSVYRIVSTRKYKLDYLMDLYNPKLSNDKLEKDRKKLQKYTLESVFNYHAYLMTRDALDFVNKKSPHSLPMTVSPKRGRLGVYPISPSGTRLPYHGVPVFYKDKNDIQIEYLIDVKRNNQLYTPVYLKGDPDQAPFLYIV